MPRTKVNKRNRQQLRQEADTEEKQRLAAIKLETALNEIDELGKRCKREVENQLQLLLARSSQQVLQLKFTQFLQLKPSHFEDLKWMCSAARTPRSQSINSRTRRMRTPQSRSDLPRAEVQSVDRSVLRKADLPPMAFLRWPKPGEVALSKAGSPLAVQSFPDRYANVHIPTKVGVLKLQPQRLLEVKREVLKQLDPSTLNQIKTLNSNLNMIVDMADKLRK